MVWQKIIFGLLLFICFNKVIAEAVTPQVTEEGIDVSVPEIALYPFASVFTDPESSLRSEDILKADLAIAEPDDKKIVSYGFTDTTHWFLIPLNNKSPVSIKKLLVFEPTWLDDIQVLLVTPDGTQKEYQGGDSLPFENRTLPHRNINFEITLPSGRSQLLVRTRTQDPYIVGMTLWDHSAFHEAEADNSLYTGILYGVLIVMLLYNLFLYMSVRESIYLAYVSYVFSFLIMHATYNGRTFPLLWPDSPAWGNWAHSVFIYLFMVAGLFFTISFLELRKRMPGTNRLAMMVILLILSSFVITAVTGGYSLNVISSIYWVIIYSSFILWTGVMSLLAGNRAARFFLIATAAGFTGSLISAMTVAGFIPFSIYSYRAVDYGMMIDAVLLSLALADRLKLARAETEKAKTKLLENTRSYAIDLEKKVEQRTKELRAANATKDKFFSIIAHDLRGPVGSLSSLFNEHINTTSDITEETLNSVRMVTRNTNSFLEQLLTWAKSQKGEIDFCPEPVDLSKVLAEMQELFSAQAQTKRIQLSLIIQEPAWVFADLNMVHIILRNLINNALKFTNNGGSVSAQINFENNYYLCRIIDTGTGINEELVNSLFHLETKPQSNPGTETESGTGLGLLLCKEFVERNGGTIGVTSELGKGSVFWFILPVAKLTQ